jgi:spermidine synthase
LVTLAAQFAILPAMRVTRTKHGLRLSQHGVVISELRTSPGPTHSVFDVLAAVLILLRPVGRIGVLGFAGGGMLAPLHGLGMKSELATVDLDQASYDLFREHCPKWVAGVRWERADAVQWLRRQTRTFDLLMDDLSVPQAGDVVKPDISWRIVPGLIRRRLKPDGVAVFNLMSPPEDSWPRGLAEVTRGFHTARIIHFDDFENRILIASRELPSAQVLGKQLRQALRQLRSRQAGRVQVRSVPLTEP